MLIDVFLRCVFERHGAVCHVCAARKKSRWSSCCPCQRLPSFHPPTLPVRNATFRSQNACKHFGFEDHEAVVHLWRSLCVKVKCAKICCFIAHCIAEGIFNRKEPNIEQVKFCFGPPFSILQFLRKTCFHIKTTLNTRKTRGPTRKRARASRPPCGCEMCVCRRPKSRSVKDASPTKEIDFGECVKAILT